MSATIVNDPARAPFVKSIFPVWEPCGTYRRVIGLGASLNGEILSVPGTTCPALFVNHVAADRALDEAIEAATALPFEPDLAEITREYVADVPSIGGAPVELVQEVAAELANTCHKAGDTRGRNSYNKASFKAPKTEVISTPDGWLVPSSQGGGIIYRVQQHGSVFCCQCEAAMNGKDCFHAALVECIELARERLADDDDSPIITFATPNYRAAVTSGLAECWAA